MLQQSLKVFFVWSDLTWSNCKQYYFSLDFSVTDTVITFVICSFQLQWLYWFLLQLQQFHIYNDCYSYSWLKQHWVQKDVQLIKNTNVGSNSNWLLAHLIVSWRLGINNLFQHVQSSHVIRKRCRLGLVVAWVLVQLFIDKINMHLMHHQSHITWYMYFSNKILLIKRWQKFMQSMKHTTKSVSHTCS